jgi:predicted ArsR family transcriptional regulator
MDDDHGPVARTTDPGTSWGAAGSVTKVTITRTRAAILRVLMNVGPMTDEQIAMAVGSAYTSPSGLRTRRKELVAAGRIRDSGRRERMDSGRWAIVWELDRPRETLFDL